MLSCTAPGMPTSTELHLYTQDSKAPEPWHLCGAGSGALALLRSRLRSRRQEPAPAEPRPVSPKIADYYYLAWFNTLHHRLWHDVATQTREPASRSVSHSTCAVLGTFAVLESCSGFCKTHVQRHSQTTTKDATSGSSTALYDTSWKHFQRCRTTS